MNDDTPKIISAIGTLRAEVAQLRETVGRIDERTKALPTWAGIATLILCANASTIAATVGILIALGAFVGHATE